MSLSAHKMLFSVIMLAALIGFGWIVIIYVLSFHAAQWAIDRIEGGSAPRQPQLRPARRVVARPFTRLSAGPVRRGAPSSPGGNSGYGSLRGFF